MQPPSYPSSTAHILDDKAARLIDRPRSVQHHQHTAEHLSHLSQRPSSSSSSPSPPPPSPPYYPPSTPHLNPNNLLILSHQSRGRGVYASRPLPSGTLVEISPVLIFGREEWERHGSKTLLDSYTFKWGRMGQMALALGLGSLFNHSASPSVSFRLDRPSHSIRYTLARDVVAGEELCISYGPWGKQYEEGSSHSDSGDVSDYDERKERELADFLKIGEDRSESDNEIACQRGGLPQRKVVRKTRTRYINGNGCPNRTQTSGSDSGVEHTVRFSNGTSVQNKRMAVGPSTASDAAVKPPEPLPPSSASESVPLAASSMPRIDLSPAKVEATPVPSSAPIWRLSSLPDPATVPLRLLSCYALSIPPRSSSEIMGFIKKHSAILGRGKVPGSEDDVIRHAKTLMKHPDDNGNLRALLCPTAKVEENDLRQLLIDDGLWAEDGSRTTLLRVQVASTPAPIKARASEWSASWPVALRSTANTTAGAPSTVHPPHVGGSNQSGPASATAIPPSSAILSSSRPGFIDRNLDSAFWSEARTQWVVKKLARCVILAQEAKDRGEIPVGVHVCPSILATGIGSNGGSSSNSAVPATMAHTEQVTNCDANISTFTSPNEEFSGAATATAAASALPSLWAGGWDSDGLPLPGGEAIEVDAFDTRRSQRNPIKHAVGNAIQRVAEIRAFKRGAASTSIDQLASTYHRGRGVHSEGSAGANGVSGHSSASPVARIMSNGSSHSELHPVATSSSSSTSLSSSPARPSSPSLPLLLNGQDYLLTSLTLFSTHEPCVYCCMSLVHSRVRTLIFLRSSPGSGGCCGSQLPAGKRCDDGLRVVSGGNDGEEVEGREGDGGPYALQEQRGLNHRFEVWKWRGSTRGIEDEVHKLRRGWESEDKLLDSQDQREELATLLDLKKWGNIDP